MTLDELISKLQEMREQVGGSVKVLADSKDFYVSCHEVVKLPNASNGVQDFMVSTHEIVSIKDEPVVLINTTNL